MMRGNMSKKCTDIVKCCRRWGKHDVVIHYVCTKSIKDAWKKEMGLKYKLDKSVDKMFAEYILNKGKGEHE